MHVYFHSQRSLKQLTLSTEMCSLYLCVHLLSFPDFTTELQSKLMQNHYNLRWLPELPTKTYYYFIFSTLGPKSHTTWFWISQNSSLWEKQSIFLEDGKLCRLFQLYRTHQIHHVIWHFNLHNCNIHLAKSYLSLHISIYLIFDEYLYYLLEWQNRNTNSHW